MQGKGIDCLATHPGIADTPLYPKLDSKPEAKAFNAFESVHHPSLLSRQAFSNQQCPDRKCICALAYRFLHELGQVHMLLPYTCAPTECVWYATVILLCTVQIYNQSGEDGAISTVRAATDPSLTGQGFKYFGPWYKGPLVIHTGNESKRTAQEICHAVLCLCWRLYVLQTYSLQRMSKLPYVVISKCCLILTMLQVMSIIGVRNPIYKSI